MQCYVTVQTPVGTALGTPLSSTLTASNTLPEVTLANNVYVDADIVVGSYDPNDKRAVTSTRASNDLYFINEDEWIDYTIRFQNTGTFPAEFVVITDTIAPELDMLSFEQGVASHPFAVSFKPGRVIEWRFDDIQLPDSTSDEPGSHGLVKFRIRPLLPLLAGTVIENVANIYFDFNPPVITEPSVLVAEFSTGVVALQAPTNVRLSPNPAKDRLYVEVVGDPVLEYCVFAADGRTIRTGRPSGSRFYLDTSALPSGLFLLEIRNAAGTLSTTRFAKD